MDEVDAALREIYVKDPHRITGLYVGLYGTACLWYFT